MKVNNIVCVVLKYWWWNTLSATFNQKIESAIIAWMTSFFMGEIFPFYRDYRSFIMGGFFIKFDGIWTWSTLFKNSAMEEAWLPVAIDNISDFDIEKLDMARHVDEYDTFCLRNLATSQPSIYFPRWIVEAAKLCNLAAL